VTNSKDYVKYDDLVRTILMLDRLLETLHPQATSLGVPSPLEMEWFSLLRRKLVPQLLRRSHLVISLMGGTNTGKSVIFNLLAGENVSKIESHAAGTRHPVAILPPNTDPDEVLPFYFEEFERFPWRSAHDPVEQSAKHKLFWKHGLSVPENLILLDTPDIDSDVEINWERANQIRQVSDLLIGVMTAQKYNDAAVKRFFREAAESGKPVILIWNMAYDKQYEKMWPEWIAGFLRETGVKPLAVFVTPHDRTASEEQTLPVYDIGPEGTASPTLTELRSYLSGIRYEELKIQALWGAVRRLIDPVTGLEQYLKEIAHTAKQYQEAAVILRNREHSELPWPTIPKLLLAEEVSRWCNGKRPEFLQNINTVYDKTLFPVRAVWGSLRNRFASQKQTLEQHEELEAVLNLLEKTKIQLETMRSQTENPFLKAEIGKLILGDRWKTFLARTEAIHASLPPKTDERIRHEIFAILDQWISDHPKQWQLLHKADVMSLGTHAVLTGAAILTCGILGAGVILGSAGVTAFLLAGGLTGSGEAAAKILGEEIRCAIAELKAAIQEKYAHWRKEMFLREFESVLWSGLLEKCDAGTSLLQSDAYLQTELACRRIRETLMS
jgi:hypothetical protein